MVWWEDEGGEGTREAGGRKKKQLQTLLGGPCEGDSPNAI